MQQIGKYKVIRELGAGGFGAVYLAEDPRLGEQVAIKVFKIRDVNLAQQATSATSDAGDVLRQRFLNEARTLRQLQRNPHIVNVFDFDEMEDGTPYYVMPYIPHSLKHELGSDATDVSVIAELEVEDKPKRLPITKALIYLEQLLIALKDVHKAGLIHRDIKPANLLLDEHGDVKLCDFGIAKVPDAEHSYSGVGMGSRNYMAPEQRQSAKHVDCSSDIYSVGVLAYRMITGTLPEGRFADPNTYQPALSETLNELILKALAQQKEQRFVDAAEMLKALKAATQNTSPTEEEATGTWVEQGSTQIKTELKPLQDRILTLLKQQGEITPKDMPVLQALADIGNLVESDLQQLISHSQQQLANDNAQFKALQGWVNAIKRQIAQASLTLDKQQALIEAGITSTGKNKEELTALIIAKQPKTSSTPQKTPEQNNPRSEASDKQAASDKSTHTQPKKSKAPLIDVVIVVVLGIGGYFGYESYQASQQSTAARNESGAVKDLLNGMVSIPAGSFMMGSNESDSERPIHRVNINAFKLMAGEVTFAMWDACVTEGGCSYQPGDEGGGRVNRPVIKVSFDDITGQFIPWLIRTTGQTFRLPSEAEWEYAARAGSTTKYSWGDSINCSQARYDNWDGDCGNDRKTVTVKSYSANAFGLYDMHGNVFEWVQDCWNDSYANAPVDGSVWSVGACLRRVLRGGSWSSDPDGLRSADRSQNSTSSRFDLHGFRLAQDLQ